MLKKILFALLILAILGGALIYYKYNKPVASLERKKPDVEVSASHLISAYEADEKTADESYLGKIVQVSGKVSEITNEEGIIKIHIESDSPMSLVNCELEEGQETGSLNVGDHVKVKGKCTGFLSDVILVQSTIVK